MFRAFAITVVFLLAPLVCHAGDSCPWLNAATAGGVLGGDVSTKVTNSTNKDDAVCTFELHRGQRHMQLTISVTTMRDPRNDFTAYLSRCGAQAMPLKAIGNEAVACGATDQTGHWEQIVSRVRDRAFVVRITTNEASVDSAVLLEKTKKTADQVAGAIF